MDISKTLVDSIGTGGTISGVGRYLKQQNPAVCIALTDPMGSCMYHYYKSGELRSEGNSISEGIGQGRVTANIVRDYQKLRFCPRACTFLLRIYSFNSPRSSNGRLPHFR